MKINTWLPDFPGFYESIYDWDFTDIEWELWNIPGNVKPEYKDWILEYLWEYFDCIRWKDDVGRAYTQSWFDHHKEIMPFIKSIEFEKVQSPRFYNFSTDVIYIRVDVNLLKLVNCFRNTPGAKAYIKETYTSRYGFISSYENNIDAWLHTLRDDLDHKIGSMMQFLSVVDKDELSLDIYEEVKNSGCYYSEYIKYNEFIQAFNRQFNTKITNLQELEQ